MIHKPGLKNIKVLFENNTVRNSELLYKDYTVVRIYAEDVTARSNALYDSRISSYAHFEVLRAEISDLML